MVKLEQNHLSANNFQVACCRCRRRRRVAVAVAVAIHIWLEPYY